MVCWFLTVFWLFVGNGCLLVVGLLGVCLLVIVLDYLLVMVLGRSLVVVLGLVACW